MDSLDQQVFSAARAWALQGHRFVLVTVARTWGSAPRPAGAWMVLREDGLVQGSVSGGCIEDDLMDRIRAGRLDGDRPFRIDYGVTRDDAERFGLPCGGRLELVVEPAPEVELLTALAHRIALGHLVQRCVNVTTGDVSLADCSAEHQVSWDGSVLTTVHGPRWRLLIIGAGQISRYLAQMAQALDYTVSICDPRTEYNSEWNVPGATWVPGMPDEVVIEMALDARSAVVALTHDPKLDDMALLEALKSPAFYVGALGSRVNNAKRRERLRQYFDLSDLEIARLHGPAGLPIGSRTPPEIAVSILAEMTALKPGRADALQAQAGARSAPADAGACGES